MDSDARPECHADANPVELTISGTDSVAVTGPYLCSNCQPIFCSNSGPKLPALPRSYPNSNFHPKLLALPRPYPNSNFHPKLLADHSPYGCAESAPLDQSD